MQKTLLILAALLAVAASQACTSRLATMGLVESARCLNYPVETHQITTEDGYRLTIFRIQAKGSKIVPNKPVALLWHGLLDSADTWIMNDERLAPGYQLANKGFDVWFGNSRGNKYNLAHVSLDSTRDKSFWEFTWQHIGEKDVPAAFSYIARLTSQKINYVGHSQGTLQMFAHLANPNGKHSAITANLNKFAALGPVAYMRNVKSTVVDTMARVPGVETLLTSVAPLGFLIPNWISSEAGKKFCSVLPIACGTFLRVLFDENPAENNRNKYDSLAGHFPAGTSSMDPAHFMQLIKTGKFQKYDYGVAGNLKYYKSAQPQQYDLSLITETVGIFAGSSDLLATPADVNLLVQGMTKAKKTVKSYSLGHMSFVIGSTLPYLDDLVNFLKN